MKTAQQAASNWSNSAGRAASDYQTGVQNYSGDWAGATTRQGQTMVTNFNASYASGKWANGVNAVGTGGWKTATIAKVGNYSTGFSAGTPNYTAASAKIMQALSTIVPNLPPRGDYNQNKNRATSLMDALHALNGQLGAR